MTQHRAKIIEFPVTHCPLEDCETYGEAALQLKMKAAQLLNEVAEGRYVLTQTNIDAIHDVNRRCREVGLAPLDFLIDG